MPRPHTSLRWPHAVALVCLAGALAAGAAHPLAPWVAWVAVVALAGAVAWRPPLLAFLVPALLPVASLMPWTGWWLLEEADLLVLAVAAGGYARWPGAAGPAPSRQGVALWGLAAGLLVVGVWRGWTDAVALHGAVTLDALQALHADHGSAWNTLRVSKAWLWCLLLAPLWARTGPRGGVWLARGMVAGLALVCAGVLWERALLVGLFDVDRVYRTTAWFWEMQVGGGAIDMFLAMALPFALWALCTARSAWRWTLAVLLWWLAVYAVLTTFSRGIALAALILLGWMAFGAWRWPLRSALPARRLRLTLAFTVLAIAVQTLWVVGSGHLGQRLQRADVDLRQRVAHWQAGLSLMDGPVDGLLGIGAGRLPARYAAQVPGGDLPGRSRVVRDGRSGGLVLDGPLSRADLAGRWTVSQRVGSIDQGPWRLRVRLRGGPSALLQVALCERHLLDADGCRWRMVSAGAMAVDGWQTADLPAPRTAGQAPWRAPLGVLQLHVPAAGQHITVEAVELTDAQGRQRLRNGDFAQGMRHWMGVAEGYYQPWHIDNLALEVLIERGLAGWLLCLWLLAWAARGLWPAMRAGDAVAWALSGALVGVAALGCVISVTEFPRLVVVLGALVCGSAHMRGQIGDPAGCKRL